MINAIRACDSNLIKAAKTTKNIKNAVQKTKSYQETIELPARKTINISKENNNKTQFWACSYDFIFCGGAYGVG